MGIDRTKIRERLAQLQNSTNRNTNLWKPQPREQLVRIVPNKFNKDNPFIELWFHYNLGGKNYLSPKSFGKPDPIYEFAIKLRESGEKENYELSKKLFPKLRIYAPIIVKDSNDNTVPTVKYWGFNRSIYQKILDLIDDNDYGDITDPTSGTDLIVIYRTPEETNTKYGELDVKPKRKTSKLHNDPKIVKNILENQPDITEIYKELSYDELKDVLENWLNAGTDEPDNDEPDNDDKESQSSVSDNTEKKFEKLFNDEKGNK